MRPGTPVHADLAVGHALHELKHLEEGSDDRCEWPYKEGAPNPKWQSTLAVFETAFGEIRRALGEKVDLPACAEALCYALAVCPYEAESLKCDVLRLLVQLDMSDPIIQSALERGAFESTVGTIVLMADITIPSATSLAERCFRQWKAALGKPIVPHPVAPALVAMGYSL